MAWHDHIMSFRSFPCLPFPSCASPLQLSAKIKGIIDVVQQAGFGNIDPTVDVYIGAHSMGGIFAQETVLADGYAALVLYGSYLLANSSVPNPLLQYPVPILTVAGELDGVTRITRMATEYTHYQEVRAGGTQDGQTHHITA